MIEPYWVILTGVSIIFINELRNYMALKLNKQTSQLVALCVWVFSGSIFSQWWVMLQSTTWADRLFLFLMQHVFPSISNTFDVARHRFLYLLSQNTKDEHKGRLPHSPFQNKTQRSDKKQVGRPPVSHLCNKCNLQTLLHRCVSSALLFWTFSNVNIEPLSAKDASLFPNINTQLQRGFSGPFFRASSSVVVV